MLSFISNAFELVLKKAVFDLITILNAKAKRMMEMLLDYDTCIAHNALYKTTTLSTLCNAIYS